MDKFILNMYNYLNGYMERKYSNISKLDREDIAQVATQGGYAEYSENCDEVNALAVAVDICEKLVSDISEVDNKNMSVFARFLPEDILDNEELLRTVRLEIWEKLLDSSKSRSCICCSLICITEKVYLLRRLECFVVYHLQELARSLRSSLE